MLILFVSSATVLICYLLYRLDVWKNIAITNETRYHEALHEMSDQIRDRVNAENKLEEFRTAVSEISRRPAYATISDVQVQSIAQILMSAVHDKKEYLN